jgi:hypothetical protein
MGVLRPLHSPFYVRIKVIVNGPGVQVPCSI